MEDFKIDDLVLLTTSGSIWKIKKDRVNYEWQGSKNSYYECECIDNRKAGYTIGQAGYWNPEQLILLPDFKVGDKVFHNTLDGVWTLLARKDLYWAAEQYAFGIRYVEVVSVLEIEPLAKKVAQAVLENFKKCNSKFADFAQNVDDFSAEWQKYEGRNKSRRPCYCDNCKVGVYDKSQCRVCWLYHNDKKYNELWTVKGETGGKKLNLNLTDDQKKTLAKVIKEGNFVHTIKSEPQACTCSMQDLMTAGCKCGQMKRERE